MLPQTAPLKPNMLDPLTTWVAKDLTTNSLVLNAFFVGPRTMLFCFTFIPRLSRASVFFQCICSTTTSTECSLVLFPKDFQADVDLVLGFLLQPIRSSFKTAALFCLRLKLLASDCYPLDFCSFTFKLHSFALTLSSFFFIFTSSPPILSYFARSFKHPTSKTFTINPTNENGRAS